MALSHDIEQVAEAKTPATGFTPKTFRVGLGASLGGTVGVAKGAAKVLVHLYFTKAAATRDTYTIRQWDPVAQAARRVLVNYGALPVSAL